MLLHYIHTDMIESGNENVNRRLYIFFCMAKTKSCSILMFFFGMTFTSLLLSYTVRFSQNKKKIKKRFIIILLVHGITQTKSLNVSIKNDVYRANKTRNIYV